MTSLPATYGDVRVMESHTEGEPTRVILSGGPDLGGGTMRERALRFEQHHDAFRRWLMLEPRGVDYLVGALSDAGACCRLGWYGRGFSCGR